MKVAMLPVKPQMMVVRVTWGVSVGVQCPATGRVVVAPVALGENHGLQLAPVQDIPVRVVPVYRVQLPVRPYAERVVVVVGGGIVGVVGSTTGGGGTGGKTTADPYSTPGAANTGGGGGGGGERMVSGSGGSGVVIIRYKM